MQNKANHSGSATGSSQKAPALVNIEGSRDATFSSASGLGKNAGFESEVSTTTAEKLSSNNKEESHQDDNQSYQSHVGEPDEDSLVAGEVRTMGYLNYEEFAILLKRKLTIPNYRISRIILETNPRIRLRGL